MFAQLELNSSYSTCIMPGPVITGLGMGLILAPSISAATAGVATEDAGVASAAVNTFQQIGGSIGTAVLSAFAATAATVLGLPLVIVTVPPRSLKALLHDAGISMLRSYSRSAFVALGRAARPAMVSEFPTVGGGSPLKMAAVVYAR